MNIIPKEPLDLRHCSTPLFFASAARVAFRHLLRHIGFPSGAQILLPSYIGYSHREGSGVLDPILELCIPFAFYRVDRRLNVDLDDLARLLSQHHVFIVCIIHYFGFLQPSLGRIKQLCNANRAFLLEDCAHCLHSFGETGRPGTQGDFSLFSIHKTLPTPDGGILKVNNSSVLLPPLAEQDRISPESLATCLNANLDQVSRARITNYRTLLDLLPRTPAYDALFPNLPPHTVPLNLPLLIQSKDRFSVYQDVRAAGVECTALYYELVGEIAEAQFPDSHSISRKILNLPIHQDITSEHLATMACVLSNLLGT